MYIYIKKKKILKKKPPVMRLISRKVQTRQPDNSTRLCSYIMFKYIRLTRALTNQAGSHTVKWDALRELLVHSCESHILKSR